MVTWNSSKLVVKEDLMKTQLYVYKKNNWDDDDDDDDAGAVAPAA